MAGMSQKNIILHYLKEFGDWQYEYKIRAIDTPWGWIVARGDRNVRELIASGRIEADYKGKYRIVRYPKVN